MKDIAEECGETITKIYQRRINSDEFKDLRKNRNKVGPEKKEVDYLFESISIISKHIVSLFQSILETAKIAFNQVVNFVYEIGKSFWSSEYNEPLEKQITSMDSLQKEK